MGTVGLRALSEVRCAMIYSALIGLAAVALYVWQGGINPSLQVRPGLSSVGARDGHTTDSESLSELTARPALSAQGSNLPDLFVSEPRCGVRLPSRTTGALTTLADHVRDVVPLRTEKQVSGVHARGVVAAMADALPATGTSASRNPERNAMRERSPSQGTDPEVSIAVSVRCAEPRPAVGVCLAVHQQRESHHIFRCQPHTVHRKSGASGGKS